MFSSTKAKPSKRFNYIQPRDIKIKESEGHFPHMLTLPTKSALGWNHTEPFVSFLLPFLK